MVNDMQEYTISFQGTATVTANSDKEAIEHFLFENWDDLDIDTYQVEDIEDDDDEYQDQCCYIS